MVETPFYSLWAVAVKSHGEGTADLGPPSKQKGLLENSTRLLPKGYCCSVILGRFPAAASSRICCGFPQECAGEKFTGSLTVKLNILE